VSVGVIIGIIAAIAIPRMSRGTSGAAESALSADMSTWRHALDLYQAEHDGKYPTDNTTIVAQLTGNTDASGTIGSGTNFPYGPYLRAVPTLPRSAPSPSPQPPPGRAVRPRPIAAATPGIAPSRSQNPPRN